MNIDSPFEQWRLKYMQGTAASREIMELLALAFEGGRVAEREACAKLCLEPIYYGQVQNNRSTVGGNKYVRDKTAQECAAAIRARGKK